MASWAVHREITLLILNELMAIYYNSSFSALRFFCLILSGKFEKEFGHNHNP